MSVLLSVMSPPVGSPSDGSGAELDCCKYTSYTQVIRSHKEDYLRAGARDLFFFFFDFLFFFFFRSFRL